jgi:hypothetical protein
MNKTIIIVPVISERNQEIHSQKANQPPITLKERKKL